MSLWSAVHYDKPCCIYRNTATVKKKKRQRNGARILRTDATHLFWLTWMHHKKTYMHVCLPHKSKSCIYQLLSYNDFHWVSKESEAQLSFAMLSASYSFTLKYTQHKPSRAWIPLFKPRKKGKKKEVGKKQMKKKDRKGNCSRVQPT